MVTPYAAAVRIVALRQRRLEVGHVSRISRLDDFGETRVSARPSISTTPSVLRTPPIRHESAQDAAETFTTTAVMRTQNDGAVRIAGSLHLRRRMSAARGSSDAISGLRYLDLVPPRCRRREAERGRPDTDPSSSARTAVTNLSAGPWQAAHLGSSAMGMRTPSFPPSRRRTRRRPWRGGRHCVDSGAAEVSRVGGIAQTVAGSPCRDPLFAADTLGDTVQSMWQDWIARVAPPCCRPESSSHDSASCIAAMMALARAMAGRRPAGGSGIGQTAREPDGCPCRPARARPTATPRCRTVVADENVSMKAEVATAMPTVQGESGPLRAAARASLQYPARPGRIPLRPLRTRLHRRDDESTTRACVGVCMM